MAGGDERKSKKSKKRERDLADSQPLMQGQTEEERRMLRQEQALLKAHITEHKGEMLNTESDKYSRVNEMNNKLFSKVKYTREAVQDAENVKLLSSLAVKRAEASAATTQQYESQRIIDVLREKGWDREAMTFDWRSLGLACKNCFATIPELGFLCGAFEKEPKEKKQRVVKEKAKGGTDIGETKFEEKVGADGENDDRVEEATTKRLTALMDLMDKKGANIDGGKDIDMIKMLVNPKSFSQTVENFFDYSFLIKDGKAAITRDKNGLPVTKLSEAPEVAKEKSQLIVSITMADLEALSEAWGHKESDVKHRPAPTSH